MSAVQWIFVAGVPALLLAGSVVLLVMRRRSWPLVVAALGVFVVAVLATGMVTATVERTPATDPGTTHQLWVVGQGVNLREGPGTKVSKEKPAAVQLASAAGSSSGEVGGGLSRMRPSAQVSGILAEVDQVTKVGQLGASYRDFRFETSPGQVAAASLVFDTAGTVASMRVVCDDVCSHVYLVSSGAVAELKPDKVYGPKFNYQALPEVGRQKAAELGVNVKDSEVLAQNLFTTPFSVSSGYQLVVYGADDPELGVNRGIFTSWNLVATK